MKVCISDIKVGKRFRATWSTKAIEADAVDKIAASFSKRGQRRPIIIRSDGKRPRLVAGARRLAAAKQLGWKHIKARTLNVAGMSPERADLEAQAAELDDAFPRSQLRTGEKRNGRRLLL